ncbi:MAG TPA: phage tail sheath C-terminal domain-containing protein, partial [Polyangiaceae bacterium]|nr:phage tail sheath C-terminal domain-containing protein [Polyangiaceae bacterium]
ITGVPTSVTVFIGRTRWGAVGTPTTITSYSQYEQLFGGPLPGTYLASCVEDFFQNGGMQAVVLRLFTSSSSATGVLDPAKQIWSDPETGKPTDPDKAGWGPALGKSNQAPNLQAASPGAWAKKLSVRIDRKGLLTAQPAASGGGAPPAPTYQTLVLTKYKTDTWDADDLFNITITLDAGGGQQIVERFKYVSLNDNAGSRRLSQVLEHGSRLVRATGGAALPPALGADSAALTDKEFDQALEILDKVETFNLICAPPDTELGDGDPLSTTSTVANGKLAALARARRAMLILDTPPAWSAETFDRTTLTAEHFTADLGVTAGDDAARYAAAYFPWMIKADPLNGDAPRAVPPCGAVAGIMARTDQSRGVWKAPAGVESGIGGIEGLTYPLSDVETGNLNDIGVNCLRSFSSTGPVLWGARTLKGSDALADDFKYVPIRRLANYMEESLRRGTNWAVFEPNDEPLWAQMRLSVGAFMSELFRQGAFQGSSAKDAYSVVCDASVNPPDDVNQGLLNVVVSYAPLKPAEFVVLYFQQKTLGA